MCNDYVVVKVKSQNNRVVYLMCYVKNQILAMCQDYVAVNLESQNNVVASKSNEIKKNQNTTQSKLA